METLHRVMGHSMRLILASIAAFAIIACLALCPVACHSAYASEDQGETSAEEDSESDSSESDSTEESARYDIGYAVNAGLDDGFSQSNEISGDDPHNGWSIGQFYVTGYSSVTFAEDGTPVFLKPSASSASLHFTLYQDINSLNGDSSLSISDDKGTSDSRYGIENTDFGRGALIAKISNTTQGTSDQTFTKDFLSQDIWNGADKEVLSLDEGDYEIALDYEVKKKGLFAIGALEPGVSYSNYSITFKFSVRNSDSYVSLLDANTGEQLLGNTFTDRGFRVDLSHAGYLTVTVKHLTLDSETGELVEDPNVSGDVSDGELFVQDGIYEITSSNTYGEPPTTTTIYVGSDDVLKAYAVTGLSLSEIRDSLAAGATVNSSGNLVYPERQDSSQEDESASGENAPASKPTGTSTWIPVVGIIAALAVVIIVVLIAKSKRSSSKSNAGKKGRPGKNAWTNTPNISDAESEPDATKASDASEAEKGDSSDKE